MLHPRIHLVLCCALSSAVAARAQAPSPEPSLEVLKLRGQVLLELRQYERAASVFEAARLRFPDDADLVFAAAMAQFGAGNADPAEAAFEQFVRLQPDEPAAWPFLARLRHQRGALEEALAACTRAVTLDPEDARSFNLRGLVELEMGLRVEAAASFAHASEADATYAAPLFNLGMLWLEDSDVDAAVDALTQAAEIDSTEADACRVLGELYVHLDAFEESARWYGRAVERDPSDVASWRGLAEGRERAGHVYEALEAWSAACDQAAATEHEFADHARVLAACGDLESAQTALERAHELAPEDTSVVDSLALVAEDRGDARGALRWLEWIDARGAGAPELLCRLSEHAEAVGDAPRALRYFERLTVEVERSAVADRAIATRHVVSTVAGIRDLERGYAVAIARVAASGGRDAADLLLLARAEAARGDHAAAAQACERAAELFDSGSSAAALYERRADQYRLAKER